MDLKFTTANDYFKASQSSDFRLWCNRMWYDHLAEVEAFTGKLVDYDSEFYFNQYKYWLKREYKFRKQNNE